MRTLKSQRNIILLVSVFILLSGAFSVSSAQVFPTFSVSEVSIELTVPAPPPQPSLVDLSVYSAIAAPAVPSGISFGLASATFSVNDSGDAPDTDTSDNVCDGDSGTAGSQCTLRAAIEQANATVDLDTIEFDLPGAAPFVIVPATVLPVITNPVVIDGTTQTGYTTAPIVTLELNGLNYGLALAASNSTITALHIAEAQIVHIQLTGSNNVVKRSYIGTDLAGTAAQSGNVGVGIGIQGTTNTIGGTAAGDGNLLSGLNSGIYVENATAVSNTIVGNAIGVNAAETAALPNLSGIYVLGARGTIIGGTAAGADNLISGNTQGIFLNKATGTRIVGNVVGLDGAGTTALPNATAITVSDASKTLIGGAAADTGNVISGNPIGLLVTGAGSRKTKIYGNLIGTNAAGTLSVPNSNGIGIISAPGTKIGGTAAGQGNLISGNGQGLVLQSASGAKVQGNKIGTDINGTTALPNTGFGVAAVFSSNITVGGTAAGARNLISGNGAGLVGQFNTNLTVQGNYIGTDLNGTAALPNTQGVQLIANSNTLFGGSVPNAGNLISGNAGPGLVMQIEPNVIVQQNLFGTDATGTAALPNGTAGLGLVQGSNALIGGSGIARNIISGNTGVGLILQGPSAGVQVQGNYIGTTKNGLAPLGNTGPGIGLQGTIGGVIGGSKALRNLISANGVDGILVTGSQGATITGNYIGTDRKGKSAAGMGNTGNGINIQSSPEVIVGGAGTLANRIFDNTANGVLVVASVGARIQGNRISGNTLLGIDLNGDTVSINDPGDADPGANNTQNYPVLTSVKTNALPKTTIKGTLNSTPFGSFVLDFYFNTECDASGFGEGSVYLGQKTVVADANGDVTFKAKFPVQLPAGAGVVATATSSAGSTSEFSECLTTLAAPVLVAPADGATGVAQGAAISWNAVGAATDYQIQIDDNDDFSSPEVDDVLTATATTADAPLAAATTYFWRVRAVVDGGFGKWSEVRDFGYTG